MPIYKENQSLKAFKGDYAPVNVYKENIKLAGWRHLELSDTTLTVHNTYNNTAWIKINGMTTAEGTDTLSPVNPYVLKSIENFDLVSTNGHETTEIYFPFTLHSIMDAFTDSILIDNVAKTTKFISKIGKTVFTGLENWFGISVYDNYVRAWTTMPNKKPGYDSPMVSTHFNYSSSASDAYGRIRGTTGSAIYFGFPVELTTEQLIKSWLAAQYAAGTPVTVLYNLETPAETSINYIDLPTYAHQTQIFTTATVQPVLNGKIKVIN